MRLVKIAFLCTLIQENMKEVKFHNRRRMKDHAELIQILTNFIYLESNRKTKPTQKERVHKNVEFYIR